MACCGAVSRQDKRGQQPFSGAPPVPSEFRPNSTAGRPGRVTTPGVLAILFGAIGAVGATVLVATAGTAEMRRSSEMSPENLRTVGIVALVVCVGAVVGGLFLLRGRNWARILVTLMAVVYAAMTIGSFSRSSLVGLAIVLIIVLMLWTKESNRWFRDQRG
jgi:lysylphosphatidylglycerol synthetase-like protein (DUF2156 family)